ncbi:MAG: hypothetical protein N2578_09370, partial [Bdellovibrionaceae bacterium]|nr:hypothetical protein [Pseudobdellovibrionaceae bacterium]
MEKAEIKLEIAIEEDSPALCEFYRKFPIEGHVQLLVDRLHNYFAPYEIESDRHVTYVLRTADREILGTATFVIKDVWLGQEKRTVAVARDLRISQDRRAITSWGDQVLPTMAEIEKLFGVDHFFSVLNLSEVRHLNTFVRPRQIRRALPRYYLFRRFNVVSLHGRLPIAHNPLPHLRVVPGSTGRLDELIYYASLKARARDLSTFWDSESFLQKLKR